MLLMANAPNVKQVMVSTQLLELAHNAQQERHGALDHQHAQVVGVELVALRVKHVIQQQANAQFALLHMDSIQLLEPAHNV